MRGIQDDRAKSLAWKRAVVKSSFIGVFVGKPNGYARALLLFVDFDSGSGFMLGSLFLSCLICRL